MVTGLNMAHQVHHLMGLLVDPAQTHLGAEGHQGRAVRLGVGDPEQQVDGPGAEGGEANPRLAGDPAVHLGHEGGALLRAHQDKAHGRIVEGIHQVDDLLAGETENEFYPLVLQAFGDKLGDVHMDHIQAQAGKPGLPISEMLRSLRSFRSQIS